MAAADTLPAILRGLTLSLAAGLTTAVGGIVVVWRRPSEAALAALLGLAAGVMTTLATVDLIGQNAVHHSVFGALAAAIVGGGLYALCAPLIPEVPDIPGLGGTGGSSGSLANWSGSADEADAAEDMEAAAAAQKSPRRLSNARLLRLGLVMAATMTIHNFPEGFAVAMTAYAEGAESNVDGEGQGQAENNGVCSDAMVMAIGIALHNVPEGIIIAAPVYAATGKRMLAVLLTLLSGLSEPVAAGVALVLLRPMLTASRLALLLSATGGIMLAVTILDLVPQGQACRAPRHLQFGAILGAGLMMIALYWTHIT